MQGMQQQQPNSSVPAAITESRDVMIFLTPNWPQQCSPLSTVFDLIKVTDEEHHGLRGPIVAIDRFVDIPICHYLSSYYSINRSRKRHHHHFYIAKLAKARIFFPKNFGNPGESNQALLQ